MSACLSVRPSVRPPTRPHGKTRLQLGGLLWYLIFEGFFWKSVEKFQISLKYDKNNGYITWRPMYIYDIISMGS